MSTDQPLAIVAGGRAARGGPLGPGLPRYTRGRVVFAGDAAHAVLATEGQGGGGPAGGVRRIPVPAGPVWPGRRPCGMLVGRRPRVPCGRRRR